MSATPVLAPVPGRAVRMEDVPDPIFAQSMVGPGRRSTLRAVWSRRSPRSAAPS
jgi:hypothetical protein